MIAVRGKPIQQRIVEGLAAARTQVVQDARETA
jgi:hypothetical protein